MLSKLTIQELNELALAEQLELRHRYAVAREMQRRKAKHKKYWKEMLEGSLWA